MAPKAAPPHSPAPSMVALDFSIQGHTPALGKLTRTPEGYKIFELLVFSSFSHQLRSFVQECLLNGQLKPNSANEALAFDLAFNALIQRLALDQDLITLIATKVEAGNGVQAFFFLRTKFAGNSVAKSLTASSDIFSTKFDTATLTGAKQSRPFSLQY